MKHVTLWPVPSSLSLWWMLREDMQIDSVDWRPNFSVAAVGWCESHLMSPTKLFTQSACWHVSFKTPKLLQVFSPRIRPLVYFQQVIWHCACELCLIYKQVNGNERLGLTRALSKPFAVSLSLYNFKASALGSITVWFLQRDCECTYVHEHCRFLALVNCLLSLTPSQWKGAL